MNLNSYKNVLSQDLKYLKDVNKAKLPEDFENIPALTSEEINSLPLSVRNFYNICRWYGSFSNEVINPFVKVLNLFNDRHIADIFKTSFSEKTDYQEQLLAYEVFGFLKSLSIENTKKICRELISDSKVLNGLMNSIITDDVSSFSSFYSILTSKPGSMWAFQKVIYLSKQIELMQFVMDMDDEDNDESFDASLNFLFKEAWEVKDAEEADAIDDYIGIFKEIFTIMGSLIENIYNPEVHKLIEEKFYPTNLLKFFKYICCYMMVPMQTIWDFLGKEEREAVNDIISAKHVVDLSISYNGKTEPLTYHVIQLAMRWSCYYYEAIFGDLSNGSELDSQDKASANNKKKKKIKDGDDNRLPFPTRLISTHEIYAQSYNAILGAIYDKYGLMFEDMSKDDFIYLFGGSGKMPHTYNPPYYWNGQESLMKALARIFYIRQPRNFRRLILHISDKEIGATSHNWGKNKDSVAYFDIEAQIINIVKQVCGADLPRL